MWLSFGVKITGRGICCILYLLMLLIYNSPQCAYVFDLVGYIFSRCVFCCVSCFWMLLVHAHEDKEVLNYHCIECVGSESKCCRTFSNESGAWLLNCPFMNAPLCVTLPKRFMHIIVPAHEQTICQRVNESRGYWYQRLTACVYGLS
jgi:hypothetical protein